MRMPEAAMDGGKYDPAGKRVVIGGRLQQGW